jgi:argininosuccinate lyase
MASVLDLLAAAIETIEVNRDLLAARAGDSFTTSTELADTLVRAYGLPFRTAHGITSTVVKQAVAAGIDAGGITGELVEAAAQSVLGHPIGIDETTLHAALDPWSFVRARSIPGGPAPEAMRRSLATIEDRLAGDQAWLAQERDRLAAGERDRAARAAAVIDAAGLRPAIDGDSR